jgi:hypothetical protein
MDNTFIQNLKDQLVEAETKLAQIEHERNTLLSLLEDIKNKLSEASTINLPSTTSTSSIHNLSPPEVKIALFRSLFRGREDVYARRWESPKTGKSGYQPDCKNDWIPGICRKPQIKCSECKKRVL